MYGIPEPLITEDSEPGKLIASISITREPVGDEPFIAISYEISLRVFCIALALSKLEMKMEKNTGSGADDKNSEDIKDKSRDAAQTPGDTSGNNNEP